MSCLPNITIGTQTKMTNTGEGPAQNGNGSIQNNFDFFLYGQNLENQNKNLSSLMIRVKKENKHNLRTNVGRVSCKFKLEAHCELFESLKQRGDSNDLLNKLEEFIEIADACNEFRQGFLQGSSSTLVNARRLSHELAHLIDEYDGIHSI